MKKIKLTQGQYTIVDNSDFKRLSAFKWRFSEYAIRSIKSGPTQKTITLHSEVLKPKQGFTIDHINGNRLDNRKRNLRHVTFSQNCQNSKLRRHNTSGYRGVSWHKNSEQWVARIIYQGRTYHCGMFKSIIDAAKSYNKMAKKLYGKYAKINSVK